MNNLPSTSTAPASVVATNSKQCARSHMLIEILSTHKSLIVHDIKRFFIYLKDIIDIPIDKLAFLFLHLNTYVV